MLKNVISFYEKNKKAGVDIKELRKYDNLKPLQAEIEQQEGKRYSLGELSDCIAYVNKWSK